ncbi:hypothetical protein CS022_03740 [Veronia nyctiphanis]|uniref:Methyltransferase type 11 domain-containing protein n=1 Tax=Veronia nyctiphanis TaxID=1278244 RepID=A0A4Q0YSH8_9GAMM|nr:methyltransferase domain-containing protein [Veronia nyctiphanis]RXJ74197.1 hypothetical protein CS022_03740 [Veronia nyctiphanis]
MKKIIIGAGNVQQDGWISTQQNDFNVLHKEDWTNSHTPNSIDCLLAEHVWEHMTLEEGVEAAKHCFEFLKPGGYIRCAVPDRNFDNDWYQNMVQVGGPGPEDHPAADHKIVYDYKQFKEVFERAGFQVELLEYCDDQNLFHYTHWNEEDGKIGRSFRFDTRNSDESLGMVSIIIDAKKPLKVPSKQQTK